MSDKKDLKIFWTNGTKYERSKRPNKDQMKPVENHTLTNSLYHNEDTWSLLNNSIYNSIGNKKEKIQDKLSDRELLQQIGFNPFLGNSYEHDIDNHNKFLKPVNTS